VKAIDLTGQRFGKLVVVRKLTEKVSKRYLWFCQCDCGGSVKGSSAKLRDGDLRSCGCLREKHGDHKTRLYRIWADMKTRCSNKNNDHYYRYGGRGITVCVEWLKYSVFKCWALANGYADDLQIDRKDNDGGYCPENCRWVTIKINNRNRPSVKLSIEDVSTIKHLINHEHKSVAEVARTYHVGTTIISNIKNNKKWQDVE
jgi:hypothetical protein